MATEFKLPDVGEGIESGVVVNIMVSEGDTIEKDQPVLELETDKAVVEVPSDVSGKIASINVSENDEVSVGQVILTVGDADGSADADEAEASEAADGEDETTATDEDSGEVDSADESEEDTSSGGGTTEFKLPDVGEGIESGIVVNVMVSVGDTIEKDQPILELETDKAVVEVPSDISGTIESINVSENDEASVGQVILTVSGGSGGGSAAKDEKQDASAKKESKDKAQDTDTSSKDKSSGSAKTSGSSSSGQAQDVSDRKLIPAAPSVRRLARELDVDIREIAGSGILGRISAEDVRAYAEGGAESLQAKQPSAPAAGQQAPSGTTTPAPPLPDFSKWGETERQPMSGIRKATVRSMTTAWHTVPMVTQFDKADITDFEKLRKQYGPKAEAVGAKLTPTAMLLKVVAGALKKFPDFNASIDTENNEIIYKKYVNIGVAVDTDAGLLVPVIKNADQKNMIELAQELGELAEKARDRKLSPDEMQGGNFNVSNLGGIGGTGFTPIVNPPQVAILGVSRGSYEPIYNRETGEFVPRMMMPLSVTYDHRLIDGASAARFLRWICTAIEDPFLMALEG